MDWSSIFRLKGNPLTPFLSSYSITDGIAGINFAGFNAAMAAGLAGAQAIGLSTEDYQKFIKMRQQQLDGMSEVCDDLIIEKC